MRKGCATVSTAETASLGLGAAEAAAHLARVPLFSGLNADEIAQTAAHSALRLLPRGAMLFRAGDPCTAFYIVLEGAIKLYVTSANGNEKVVEIFGPGQSFAEGFLFLDEPYTVHAQALQETLVMVVHKEGVLRQIARDPRFALHMLAGVSRRLRQLIADVESDALHSGTQRLIGYLLRSVDSQRQPDAGPVLVQLPVSKAIVASRLSMTAEYFSRVLHELQNAGLIDIQRRIIRINDVAALQRWGKAQVFESAQSKSRGRPSPASSTVSPSRMR
ncbi:MAG: Crp/Fnr family transcriptional regulator [Rhodoferax sp.]